MQQPRTIRGVLENYCPELLKAAEEECAVLAKLQSLVIELLPLTKKMLPCNIDQLHNIEAQANLMAYIYHYSLFAFADKAYTTLKEQCAALAEALDFSLEAEGKEATENLEKTLEALGRIPFASLLVHSSAGLLRLETFKEYLQKGLDFLVFPAFNANGTLHAKWSFCDIIGTIVKNGLSDVHLLADCNNAPLPCAPTIGKVADDENLMRFY